MKKILILFILFSVLILSIPLIHPQVISPANVVDLAEKARDFFIEATKGNIVGQTTINKFGRNDDLGTTTEDVQLEGGILSFLESPELISVVSSDTTNDIQGGANANSIRLIGLDGNFSELEEVVNLSATPTNTTNEFIRVYRMYVEETGNYSVTNTGTITAIAALSGTTQIIIGIAQGQSETTHYTVPAGREVIISGITVTIDSGKVVTVRLLKRENADDIISPFSAIRVLKHWEGLDVPFQADSRANLKFPEKTDIWFDAVGGSATQVVEVDYDMVVYDIGT